MKKEYMQPTTLVAQLRQQGIICGSEVRNVDSNEGLGYGGAGDGSQQSGGAPRSRQHTVWDEEEE